jgi:hypothetical protein
MLCHLSWDASAIYLGRVIRTIRLVMHRMAHRRARRARREWREQKLLEFGESCSRELAVEWLAGAQGEYGCAVSADLVEQAHLVVSGKWSVVSGRWSVVGGR